MQRVPQVLENRDALRAAAARACAGWRTVADHQSARRRRSRCFVRWAAPSWLTSAASRAKSGSGMGERSSTTQHAETPPLRRARSLRQPLRVATALAHVRASCRCGGDSPRRSAYGLAMRSPTSRSAPADAASSSATPLCATLAVPADLAAPPTRWGNRMHSFGRTFLFPALHAGPFVTTYFGHPSRGLRRRTSPGGPDSRLFQIDRPHQASSASRRPLNLGIQITDWLGIEAQGRALAVIGTSGQSIIYGGGQISAGGFAAPIVRIAGSKVPGRRSAARAQIGELSGILEIRACSSLRAAVWRVETRRTRRPRRAQSVGRSSTAAFLGSSWRARTRSTSTRRSRRRRPGQDVRPASRGDRPASVSRVTFLRRRRLQRAPRGGTCSSISPRSGTR